MFASRCLRDNEYVSAPLLPIDKSSENVSTNPDK